MHGSIDLLRISAQQQTGWLKVCVAFKLQEERGRVCKAQIQHRTRWLQRRLAKEKSAFGVSKEAKKKKKKRECMSNTRYVTRCTKR